MTNGRIAKTSWKMSWAQNIEMSQLGNSKGINWLQFLDNACAAGLIKHNQPSTLTQKEYDLVKRSLQAI